MSCVSEHVKALSLSFDDEEWVLVGRAAEHKSNYDIRAIPPPRRAFSQRRVSMSHLQTIERDLREVLSFIEFNEGHRYGDYVAGVDKVAAYGVGALLAGKLAAKVGLFKLLLVFAAKSWKLLIIAALAIGAFVKKLLSGRLKSFRAPRNKELS